MQKMMNHTLTGSRLISDRQIYSPQPKSDRTLITFEQYCEHTHSAIADHVGCVNEM